MATFAHHNLIGWTVGAKRWPYHGSHPGCWGTPWKGEVLAINDVRAWTNTLAFHGAPTQEEVDAHVSRLIDMGYLGNSVPVFWNFDEPRVYWETVSNLVGYEQDLADWNRERDAAFERERQRASIRAA